MGSQQHVADRYLIDRWLPLAIKVSRLVRIEEIVLVVAEEEQP